MIISQTAKTYAKGLILAAQAKTNSYDAILDDLQKVNAVITNSIELASILNSPAVTKEQKILIIQDIFSNKVSKDIINFLNLIAEKNRFNELSQIIEAYKEELDGVKSIKRIKVISAIDLSENYKNKITETFNKKLDKTIIADWQVNKDIIAGLIVHIGDDVIDTSIKNKLKSLSKIKGNL